MEKSPPPRAVKLHIRSKFIGILAVASLLPLAIALLALNWFGGRYYLRAQGAVCQTAASQFALSISTSLRQEIDLLAQWTDFMEIGARTLEADATEPGSPAAIAALDGRWASLPADAPEVASRTQNKLAEKLREFREKNPDFAEILIADRSGRLVAATNKTSDFWQADERWWQRGIGAGAGNAYAEGLTFDESANSHSIEVSLPLFVRGEEAPVGVLKGILNVTPFFGEVPAAVGHAQTVQEVVLGSGEILARIGEPGLPPLSEKLPLPAAHLSLPFRAGWGTEQIGDSGRALIGFSPISFATEPGEDLSIEGLRPLWTIVRTDEAAAMAPLHRSMLLLSFVGVTLCGGFVFLGYLIASQKIIAPLTSLRKAAHAISRTVTLDEVDTPSGRAPASRESVKLLQNVTDIRTGDEIESLASEFAFMGRRILSYHEKLEAEIAEKTREIRRDLDFARQFQENLMPKQYPRLSLPEEGAGLSFYHIYRPASTMGGDFFNVIRLSDSKAGIFIADVMGHGARSALVTAILAALLQDAEGLGSDPAGVLQMLNSHFYKVVKNADDVIFVTAFYLVLDIGTMEATYASAGHPSPLLLDRETGEVVKLTPRLKDNPALGLFKNCAYQTFSRTLKKRDLFLLFTDGLFECRNPRGEEFGQERLAETVREGRDADLINLADSLVAAADTFSGQEKPDDDICLVGVEVDGRAEAGHLASSL